VLETVISLATPYVAYVAAEVMHVSGVTAVVVASVILAGQATRLTNAQIRLQVNAVYDTVVFLLESVVFSLIGLHLPVLIRTVDGDTWAWIGQAAAITATLLAVRALWVFPLWLVVRTRRGEPRSWRIPAVVSWAGARGVLPLAAALSIPLTTSVGEPLAGRDEVLLLTTAVIVITLVVQGFTLGPLVRHSGIAVPSSHIRSEEAAALLAMSRAALDHLEELENLEAAPEAVVTQLRDIVQSRLDRSHGESGDAIEPVLRQLRRDLIAIEANELTRLYEEGVIGAKTRRHLQRRLDLEEASLDE
jgi:NhaP-type Na+/H+ or K+/H+ antiporter